jgi:hypothetical protein
MRNLTLSDLKLGLKELLETRATELQSCASGRLYQPLLAQKRNAIEALPDVLTRAAPRGAPLTVELSEADARHDSLGTAIWHLTEAVMSHPALDALLKDSATRIRQTFVPELAVLRRPYADEAAAAHDKRSELITLKDDLKRVAVPGGSPTLYGWVKSFLDAGDEIARLLSERAQLASEMDTAHGAGALRSSTIGLLIRFRATLADEMESSASLPSNFASQLFAHLDDLSRRRSALERRRTPTFVGEPAATASKPKPST